MPPRKLYTKEKLLEISDAYLYLRELIKFPMNVVRDTDDQVKIGFNHFGEPSIFFSLEEKPTGMQLMFFELRNAKFS
jgi:hypothetical protein